MIPKKFPNGSSKSAIRIHHPTSTISPNGTAQIHFILSDSLCISHTHQYTVTFFQTAISSPGNIANTPNSKPATSKPI